MSWPSAVPRYQPIAMRKMGGITAPLSASAPSLLHSYGNVANSNQPSKVPTFYTWKTLLNPRTCPSKAQRMQLALPQRVYHPFHYEANDFFRMPLSKYQLSMRAAERGWANPVWFREDTVRLLHLNPIPFEAPIALWLPQTGDTYRLLSTFIPRVQHYILRRFHLPPTLNGDSHIVLAADWKRYMATPEMNIEFIGHSSPSFKWQTCISQLTSLFDSAYDIASPHLSRLKPSDVFTDSRIVTNNQQVPPNHPHKRMWVSTAAARFAHAESYLWINSSVPHSSTVVTPFHGGLMFNAAQLHSNSTITDKTLEVMELIRKEHRDEILGLSPRLVEHSQPQLEPLMMRPEAGACSPHQEPTGPPPQDRTGHDSSSLLSDDDMMSLFESDDGVQAAPNDDSPKASLSEESAYLHLAAEDVDAIEELRMQREGNLPVPCASEELLRECSSIDDEESLDLAAQADFKSAESDSCDVLSSLPEVAEDVKAFMPQSDDDIDSTAQVDLSLSLHTSHSDLMEFECADDAPSDDLDPVAATDDRETLVSVIQQQVKFCASLPTILGVVPQTCSAPTSILSGVSFTAGGMA